MKNKKLMTLLAVAVMSFSLAACGGDSNSGADANTNQESDAGNAEADADTADDAGNADADAADDAADAGNAEADAADDTADNTAEDNTADAVVSDAAYGLNYGAEPDAFVGTWVLSKAYTAADGDLEVPADACTLQIETSIDANKLVDEAAYIHADAINLKGTMSFNYDGISVEDYSCTGAWSDWTVVDVVGEGEAYFKGAVKFKVRDDDEGVFFDVLTGKTIDDMELFDVLGMTANGELVLGYSEDHIEKAGDAEWEYAYIFTKAN